MATAKNLVESSRDIVQDLLVPELKALKASQEALHNELSYLRAEIRNSVDSLRTEVKNPIESFRTETKLRDEIHIQAIRNLSEKLDFSIEFRERLASLEARSPRQ